MRKLFVFFDVDSTVVSIETLDYLVAKSLAQKPPTERIRIAQEISTITDKGMNGEIDLKESIRARIRIGKITKKDVEDLAAHMTEYLTTGIEKCIQFLQENNQEVFLLSSGFQEYLQPLAEKLGIPKEHVFGNKFLYDQTGKVIGADETNPLITADGKRHVITDYKKEKNEKGFFIMVGDGINDLATRTIVNCCIGFGAHKIRKKVQQSADRFVTNTRDLLTIFRGFLYDADTTLTGEEKN